MAKKYVPAEKVVVSVNERALARLLRDAQNGVKISLDDLVGRIIPDVLTDLPCEVCEEPIPLVRAVDAIRKKKKPAYDKDRCMHTAQVRTWRDNQRSRAAERATS